MIEEFDRIFVISDLHLGGAVGCRAFREADALQRFILKARDDDAQRVALVINGDVFDFLAYGEETPEFNFHPEALLRGMAVQGDELRPVFEALSAFARDPRDRQLVLQIGNHDIEMALPSAQQTLRELLQLTDPCSSLACASRPRAAAGCARWERGWFKSCTAMLGTPGTMSTRTDSMPPRAPRRGQANAPSHRGATPAL
jgi:hypothetical protein